MMKPPNGLSALPREKIIPRGSRPTVFIMANGCPENRIDAAYIHEFLKSNGFGLTTRFRAADLIIFSACALTHEIQERSLYLIDSMYIGKKTATDIYICGCLPKINAPRLRHHHTGFSFDSNDPETLAHIFETRTATGNVWANYLLPMMKIPLKGRYQAPFPKDRLHLYEALKSPFRRRRDRAINVFHSHSFCIKIATGCMNRCTYCAIRHSRGPLHSKPVDEVMVEFERGLSRGYREFALIGTNTGDYGRDRDTDLCELLAALIKNPGDYGLRLRNIHPRRLIRMWPELQKIFRSGKVAFLSSAMQSGSPAVLERMRRSYDLRQFEACILALRNEFPHIQLRTQVMVGFPGESDDDFAATWALLERLPFDFVEVYHFQARPGTEALQMGPEVPHRVARQRYHRMVTRF